MYFVRDRVATLKVLTNVSFKTQQKIEELGWRLLPHAPYSPDLSPSDYHLFRSMEHSLRNMQLVNIHDVWKWVGDFFASKPATFYDTGIRNLRERCKRIIATQGGILHFLDFVLFLNKKNSKPTIKMTKLFTQPNIYFYFFSSLLFSLIVLFFYQD